MIHQYKSNGYNIVMDINSGAIHVVDDVVYDIIELYEGHEKSEIMEMLASKYPKEDIEEAFEEIETLIKEESLFTEDTYKDYIIDFKKRKTVVKALCLHIAHDCNLACRYCFAEEGEYHGRRAIMSYEVGKQALDFLIANSGNRRNLEVDFFGGEPLMNWDVVKRLVEYGREQEKIHDKNFRFTLTTNGVLLNDEIMEFCNKEMANVVLSVDGRKEVHDNMRPFRNGSGSYDLIMPKFEKFAESRHQTNYYVRGTFTHFNKDFAADVLSLADKGFKQISVEPVVGGAAFTAVLFSSFASDDTSVATSVSVISDSGFSVSSAVTGSSVFAAASVVCSSICAASVSGTAVTSVLSVVSVSCNGSSSSGITIPSCFALAMISASDIVGLCSANAIIRRIVVTIIPMPRPLK